MAEKKVSLKDIIASLEKNVKTSGVETSKDRTVAEVALADVQRYGDKLILPERMKIDEAIEILQRKKKYDDEEVSLSRDVPCFPWDGALSFTNAMKELFGWVTAEPIKTWFGNVPPNIIQVEVGYGRHHGVAWGQFSLPGISGVVSTGITVKGNPPLVQFRMTATVKRVDSAAVTKLFDLTEALVQQQSIYRGQAIKIRFKDADGDYDQLPMPKFLDLSQVRPEELVFSNDIETAVNTNLFALLEHTEQCRAAGIPLKRGILFEGPYGVGKSLAAYVTALKSTQNGWTYLYCEHADELQSMVKFAHQYQPAVIFCEDIDRVVAGDRNVAMDDILNIIDGIEAKNTDIIIVLTTNFIGKINKAMLRPGRLDAIISVRPPDADAVHRLILQYSRGQLVLDGMQDQVELDAVCNQLAGKVPAAIRECVERAKLSAIKLSNGQSTLITVAALRDSAISMQAQFSIMAPNDKVTQIANTREDLINEITRMTVSNLVPSVEEIMFSQGIEEIHGGPTAEVSEGTR